VLKYPHPSLRAHNEEVTVFDTELQDLAKNMFKVSLQKNQHCFNVDSWLNSIVDALSVFSEQ
jgi:peptide deformylase